MKALNRRERERMEPEQNRPRAIHIVIRDTPYDLIACVILAGRAMAPLNLVASLLSRLQQSRKALQGLNEIMEMPIERDDRGNRYLSIEYFLPEVQVRNLKFTYASNDNPVINDIDLTIRPGERVALLGSIGSGKSTLLRLLMGLYQAAAR